MKLKTIKTAYIFLTALAVFVYLALAAEMLTEYGYEFSRDRKMYDIMGLLWKIYEYVFYIQVLAGFFFFGAVVIKSKKESKPIFQSLKTEISILTGLCGLVSVYLLFLLLRHYL